MGQSPSRIAISNAERIEIPCTLWSSKLRQGARFEITTVLTLRILVFWVVTQSSGVIGSWCFERKKHL